MDYRPTPPDVRRLRTQRKLRERIGINIYVLPNLLTTCNMFCGFFSVIYAMRGEFITAAYAIVVAAIFDLLDGRVARLTKTSSAFGAEYDSLSDVISFGMAPAILLYLWALQPFGRVGWLASFAILACAALRLARFNVQASEERNYFQGLPTPMAAGIVSSAVLCFHDLGWDGYKSPILLGVAILLALTMVSTFRYRSFKDLDFRKKQPFPVLVVGVLLFIVIAWRPEVMLFVLFLTYASLGAIFGVFFYGKHKKESPNYDTNFPTH
ncbi:MAG: CDP-diacylglycerol--serine O-phosphatidyltransferase [Bdellovibrionales bacterium]|nr:CDP-diacylglycerol--serine O-phosphatidyltransferase [Bdellovibrionales bacterium]